MLFNSLVFLVFLAVVLPLWLVLPNKRAKAIFLLGASYVFYGYWDWRFCSLLALSTLIDYTVGSRIHLSRDEKTRKFLLLVSLASNLGILAVFKYSNFFVESFIDLSRVFGYGADFVHLNIILPVGISFYTFQTLSYTFDIYRRELEPARSFVDFALFVSFFPQLVAGPIERARTLLPQLENPRPFDMTRVRQGVVLIVTGLFRKVIIGDTSGRYVDHMFGNMEQYASIELLCALLLFSVQIYADFSGYSHIARGTAKLFGVELMKNFEQPYLSRNITDFWRRWHISLPPVSGQNVRLSENEWGKKRTSCDHTIRSVTRSSVACNNPVHPRWQPSLRKQVCQQLHCTRGCRLHDAHRQRSPRT